MKANPLHNAREIGSAKDRNCSKSRTQNSTLHVTKLASFSQGLFLSPTWNEPKEFSSKESWGNGFGKDLVEVTEWNDERTDDSTEELMFDFEEDADEKETKANRRLLKNFADNLSPPSSRVFDSIAQDFEKATDQVANAQIQRITESLQNVFEAKKAILAMFILEHFYHNSKNSRLFAKFAAHLFQLGLFKDLENLPLYYQVYLNSFKTLMADAYKKIQDPQEETDQELIEYFAKQLALLNCNVEVCTTSRYREDFHEHGFIGKGGFGCVLKVQHKLDGAFYAMKKIKFKDKGAHTQKVLREIKTLARLDHQNVCRYYQAWIEPYFEDETSPTNSYPSASTTVQPASPTKPPPVDEGPIFPKRFDEDLDLDTLPPPRYASIDSDVVFERDGEPSINFESESSRKHEEDVPNGMDIIEVPRDVYDRASTSPKKCSSYILYIQMQLYEEQTLKEWLEPPNRVVDVHGNHKLFRQICEGIKYIHDKGFIHRDLKPANIFIAKDRTIKVGDFGLAKELEELEGDQTVADDDLASTDSHTSGVGTATYAPPEQLKRRNYDFKVDIYSLGIILFELFFPFSTYSERVSLLRDLKNGEIPTDFRKQYPNESAVIMWLMSANPSDRPTAAEILNSSLLRTRKDVSVLQEQLSKSQEIINQQESRIKELERELLLLKETSRKEAIQ